MSGTVSGGGSHSAGQVLGATTGPAAASAVIPMVAGASILPVTGNNPLVMILVITSMAVCALVIVSFIASRIIRKLI